jgi:hypothetical protein
MPDQPLQTYATHAHQPRLTGAAGALALAAFVFLVGEAVRRPGPLAYGLLCLVLAVMVLVAISRIYIVRLQDRIIRLEMRVRLARLGRESDYARLSTPQLVALRFASDAELPALIQRALAENLTSRQIKQAIRDWQPDYHRT